jgi:alpha-galactosidase
MLSVSAAPALAQNPPMGWNSWDSYGLSVTESEFEANADYMAQHLLRYGWEYAVVDEGWYLPNPEAKPGSFRFTLDAQGRYIPAVNRFPSAAGDGGFRKLADWVHARKLKFGIHIIRGIPREAVNKNLAIAGSKYSAAEAANKSDTCAWNADNYGIKPGPAGQAYYDSIAALYAGWGIDFVKIDCISYPYLGDEIRMFSEALRKTGRPIVLSLSPGPTPLDKAADVPKYAHMWRISGDVWDHWQQTKGQEWTQGLLGQFQLAASWAPDIEPRHWPDADMLPIGYLGPRPGYGKPRQTNFTQDEQRTLLALWSIFRSPLIMGGNLTKIDSWTNSLITNQEVIAVDQNSSGGRQVVDDGKKAVWVAKTKSAGGMYVAVFNLADAEQTIEYPLQSLGSTATSYKVRDLWEQKDKGSADRIQVTLRPHASVLYRLSVVK